MDQNDIVAFALSQHKLAGNAAISWTVCFMNGNVQGGSIRDYGAGRYALINPRGPMYFTASAVAYLFPGD